jgi:uncharacterized protein (TIGR02466 family)
MQQLVGEMRRAITVYAAEHPQLASLGYGDLTRLELNAWALICGADAHETWHIHPGGALSGVFYVAAPDDGSGDPRSGTIEFGPLLLAPDSDSLEWPRRVVRPEPGLMLLFPSHMAHRTWPSGAESPRICVAFDAVIPASPAAA